MYKINVIILITLLSIAYSHFSQAEASKRKMHIAIDKNMSFSADVEMTILSAYNRLGYSVKFYDILNSESLTVTNSGKLDAESVRTTRIEKFAPNLIRVPARLGKGTLKLFCLKEVLCALSVLNEPTKVIGVVKAPDISSIFMQNKEASTYHLTDVNSLAKMMDKGRLEYILALEDELLGNLVSFERNDHQSLIISQFEAFHYVHKKHLKLVPELTKTLTQVIKDNNRNPKN